MSEHQLLSGQRTKSAERKYDDMKEILSRNVRVLGKDLNSAALRDVCFREFIEKNNSTPWTASKYYQKAIQDLDLIVDSAFYIQDVLNDQIRNRSQLQELATAAIYKTDKDGNKQIDADCAKVKVQALKGKNDINKNVADIVLKNQSNKNQKDRNRLLDDRNNIDKDKPITNINITGDDIDVNIIQLLQADKKTARKMDEEFEALFNETEEEDILEAGFEIKEIEPRGH